MLTNDTWCRVYSAATDVVEVEKEARSPAAQRLGSARSDQRLRPPPSRLRLRTTSPLVDHIG